MTVLDSTPPPNASRQGRWYICTLPISFRANAIPIIPPTVPAPEIAAWPGSQRRGEDCGRGCPTCADLEAFRTTVVFGCTRRVARARTRVVANVVRLRAGTGTATDDAAVARTALVVVRPAAQTHPA